MTDETAAQGNGAPPNFEAAPSMPRGRVARLENEDIGRIGELRRAGQYFWLDLHAPTQQMVEQASRDLGLHPLTIEDLERFGQRAKIEDYDSYVYIVSYGAAPVHDEDRIAEIHIIYSPEFLLTVGHDDSLELSALHDRIESREYNGHELLHAVLDTLVDSFAPLLEDIDDQIDAVEERVVERDLRNLELDIHNLRRRLGLINRVVHRQTEAYTRLREAMRKLPDHDIANAPYFRDMQDHLLRIAEATDSMRDRVAGVFEVYLAALDNRQNVIMKQFTVIAGVFLPLSVLTGFFGMNFAWMVTHINSALAFFGFAIVFPIAVLALILTLIRRRGLLED